MASIPLLSPPAAAASAASVSHQQHSFPSSISALKLSERRARRLRVSSPTNSNPRTSAPSGGGGETIFFDGGAHYGDLVANLVLGLSLLWLPLTLAAVSRAMYLRYRFTNVRVTVISGLTGQERSDFGYGVVKDVQVVPRFVGEWGDVIITLKEGTKVDLRSVPRFREIANYCLSMAQQTQLSNPTQPKGF
ncbi:hypothetical protein Fmac_003281 [Flemingia macrophylla]|uniref:YdbS-like PH domain-containing protein n=1 Tax=Flemingia macrophylla TaxID=520843 RepID=A0ABD1NMG3_9FABA